MSFHRDIGLSRQPREPRDSAATTDWIFDIAVKNGKLTVPLLPSAIGRMCNFKPGIATPIIFAFMLAGPIYDLITRRKIHPAYLVGLVVIVVTAPPLRLALGKTALWHHLFARAVILPG